MNALEADMLLRFIVAVVVLVLLLKLPVLFEKGVKKREVDLR